MQAAYTLSEITQPGQTLEEPKDFVELLVKITTAETRTWSGHAQRAVALDDSLAQAHATLGAVYLWKKQYDQAIAEAERAIALDANFAEAYTWLGETLRMCGPAGGSHRVDREGDAPQPPLSAFLLILLRRGLPLMGRYEEAIAAYKKALTRNPDLPPAHHCLAVVYSELGREEEARAEAAEVLRINPKYSLEVLRQSAPYKDPAVLERMLAALRKAGLK